MPKPLIKRILVALSILVSLETQAGQLSAYFSFAAFDQPGKSPYLETYLQISGTSVHYAPLKSSLFQSTVEVQWVYKKGDKIVSFDKYLLKSPEMDTLGMTMPPDFLDLQRTELDTGTYELELTLTDRNSNEQSYKINQRIDIHFPKNAVSVSDIELLERYRASGTPGKFTKSGYDLYPFVQGYYPKEVNRIIFYTEIYRSKEYAGSDVLVRYMISNNETKQVVNELVGTKKQATSDVVPLLAELPIDQLPSGNYQLNVEVRDRENKLLAYRQAFFQRINPITKPLRLEDISLVNANNTFAAKYTNADTLKEYIACLTPILSPLEGQIAENQLRVGDVNNMQQFFYYFWSKKEPMGPEQAWTKYREEVEKVNTYFSMKNRKGYETERGRVYLKYGSPNTIVKEIQDPESYPYEIWHYYRLGTQTNRRFVFYAPDMASNNFRLLHSDARGELQDPNWELKLHSRSQAFGPDLDQAESYDIYGSRTKENFKMPR